MQRLLKLTGTLVLVFGITACPQPPEEGDPFLVLTASPPSIDDVGGSSTLRVTATDALGKPGTGSVVLTTPAGVLDNDQKTATLTLADGVATATIKCPKAQDANCKGLLSIQAQWETLTAKTNLVVGSGGGSDGGTDGGINPPPTDGGSDAGVGLSLAASKSRIFFNVGDSSLVTATLKRTNGSAWAGETIAFDTTLGGLTQPDGGTPATSLSATTGADGTAAVRFVETGSAGTATITAKHEAGNQTKNLQVTVTTVQQITYKSTLCSGTACTIMGVRGSGFNEQAQITFTVKDSFSNPAAGVPVTFSIPNAPSETTVTPSGVTNAQGEVTATISAGPTIGAFVVHATAIAGSVEVDSPTIGIRGAKSSNGGFTLQCDRINIGAHVSPSPPAQYEVNCKVKVVDRFNNPVGTGTTVNFKTEAGTITNSVITNAYSTTGSNTNEGEGTVTFKTLGGRYPPIDVDPLDALPGQFPFARYLEPRAAEGQLIRNPRDSLVTIIAYTRGEEFFSDDNSNGVRDPEEQFIDQGEPYVDSNDNGIRDEGEIYIDEAPADGKWNGPNGKWDKDTSIWTEAHMLYTGRPIGQNTFLMLDNTTWPPSYTDFSGPCGFGALGKGKIAIMNAFFGDVYFNRPQAQGTTFAIAHTATKGSVAALISGLQDGYGFGLSRLKVNAADGTDCLPTTKVCTWKTQFYRWDYGYVGDFRITGAGPDNNPCAPDTVSVSTTVLGVTLTTTTSGGIE